MSRQSIEFVREIAEAVARDEHRDVEITAIMPCESRGAYAEVLVTRRGEPGAGPKQVLIGIARDLPEPELRRTFSARLRATVTQ
jgi:hypothetical protein